jgi:hypothetical protein
MSTITGKTLEQVKDWVSTQPHFAARWDQPSGCLFLRNDNETLRISRKIMPGVRLKAGDVAETGRLYDWDSQEGDVA